MATVDQPLYTTTDRNAQRREITDAILLLEPMDTPFLTAIGLDSAPSKFRLVGDKNTKIEWLEDTYRPLTGTLSATSASNGTTLTVSDASVFKRGDVLELTNSSERAWVSAVDVSGNTITVTRAFGGTTAATQATGTINIVSTARAEGDTSDFGPVQARSTNYNYTQIFQEAVKVSGSDLVMAQYGIANELDLQVRKKVKEQWRFLEKTYFTGVRGTATVGSAELRSMGGLDTFVTVNTMSTAASSLTLGNLESVILSCYTATGEIPDTLWMAPSRLQTIKNLYDNSNYLTVQRSENTIGMDIIRMVTPWGTHTFKASQHCPTNRIFFLNSQYVGGYTYRPWAERDLPNSGDYESRELVGEFSLIVAQDKSHGRINLT